MMARARFSIGLAIAFCTMAGTKGRCQEVLLLTETGPGRPLISEVGEKTNLSPALLAIRDGQGVLRGNDETGTPIISVPSSIVSSFRASKSVRSASTKVPGIFKNIKRLKLSYDPGNPPTKVELERIGLNRIEDYEPGNFIIAEPFDGRIDWKLAESIQKTPKIQYASPSFRIKVVGKPVSVAGDVKPPTPKTPDATLPCNDPRWLDLWGMRSIQAPAVWPLWHGSPKVIVAVIDSGVDYDHQDLQANMWSDGQGNHGYDYVAGDAAPMDELGHGTHCAGIVGAEGNNKFGVVGVNWHVQIMAVRWIDATGDGEVENAIKSINFAVSHGAKILSNSWYWRYDDPDLEKAIRKAQVQGVIFVTAASNYAEEFNNYGGDNDNPNTKGRYPSAYQLDNIISVAALDDSQPEKRAGFSNFGRNTVHLAAPGVSILSTTPGQAYARMSGTSMAAPHVAGALALMMANPQYTGKLYGQLRMDLLGGTRQVPDLQGRCVSGGTLDLTFLLKRTAGR